MVKTKKRSPQRLWNMKGCSARNLGRKSKRSGGCWGKKGGTRVCRKCPSTCRCGPNCNCKHNCPGKCYLKGKKGRISRNRKQRGGDCGCGLQLGGAQQGGCGSCLGGGLTVQSGGSSSALVGNPWSISNEGNANYYSLNEYKSVDPQTSMISERDQQTHMNGGTRNKKAGGFIPQDLINLGRSMVYGAGSAYNTLNGYQPIQNPLPFKGQLPNTPSAKALGY